MIANTEQAAETIKPRIVHNVWKSQLQFKERIMHVRDLALQKGKSAESMHGVNRIAVF